ncbi:hypothetical protein AB0E69_13500 [Kribbella sp. NPDC026611]|uniref:hypothetical protein n=1 Tax=Kribbella sp. NPDC026611 TaxID=3154911 RepID=UPI0033D4F0AE
MVVSRRAFVTLAAGVVLLSGCSRQAPLEWLGSLDGVEKASLVDGKYVLTLTQRLPDDQVRSLVDKLKRELGGHVKGYYDAVELAVDAFRARIYPAPTSKVDQDLDRTLWLRQDGRALKSTYGSSGLVITTPAVDAAAVALGFDQVSPTEDGRRTHRVESVDRSVVIEWTDSPSLGFRLDRPGAQQFADLQKRYPGLTGWIDASNKQAGVYFAARDISLDALLAHLPSGFGKLELGWGPARAPAAEFATAFTPAVRRLTATLDKIPGVARLDLATVGPHQITVRTGAAYVAVVKQLGSGPALRVDLVRHRSKYVGREGNWVFEGWTSDDSTAYRVHSALADNAGVVKVQVGDSFSNLVLAETITNQDLTAAHAATKTLTPLNLYTSPDPDSLDIKPLGKITNGHYTPPSPAPALATRIATTWSS